MDLVAKLRRETPHDRQTQPHAGIVPHAGFATLKLHEDGFTLCFRNTGPGIVDLNAKIVAAHAATHQYPAALGVAQRVGEQVLQNPPQHERIGYDRLGTRADLEREIAFGSDRSELLLQGLEQRSDSDWPEFRFEHARVKL